MTLVPVALGVVILASGASAQNILTNQQIVSAKSGVIQYYEGTVLNGSKAVESRNGHFEMLRDGETLKTEAGRAELLLQPSVFLRVGGQFLVVCCGMNLLYLELAMTESMPPRIV